MKPGEIVYKFVEENPVPKLPALAENLVAEGIQNRVVETPVVSPAAAPAPVKSPAPAIVVPAKLVSNEPPPLLPAPKIAAKTVVPATEAVYPRRETR